MALGRVYCVRADVPRREVEDAPPPDRVLDGRARDGLRDARRRDGRSPKGWSSTSSAACSRSGKRELKVLERDTTKLEKVQAPFPRISYDEAVEILKEKGLPFEWGGDFGAPDETALSEEFDRPVCVHRYPSAVKAFYMKPDPERPEVALGVDVLAPEGYGEIIGGGERLADLRPAAAAHQGAQPAAGSVRVVSRSAPLRHACRTAASAWASSASSAGSAGSSTCARRFRTRACCIGCIRDGLAGLDDQNSSVSVTVTP